MKHASHILMLTICVATSAFSNLPKRTFEQVSQEFKEAAPAFIDWGMSQIHKYPAIPGILTAAVLSKAKESITLKRSSFVVWATLGAVVLAEPYRLFAQEYLAQRNMQKKDNWEQEIEKAKENAKAAGHAVVLAAQKGSQELVATVTEKLNELGGNEPK